MKVTINRIDFIKAIVDLSAVAKENRIRPVISGIRLMADSKVTMTATDLETTLQTSMEGTIEHKGTIVFAHSELLEYIKELDEKNITIEKKENVIEIVTENSTTTFVTYDETEYPNIKIDSFEKEYKIESKLLLDILVKVKIAMNTNTEDIAMCGVRMMIGKSNTIFATTDSFRMATYDLQKESNFETELTIPKNGVELLIKLLKNIDNEIKLTFSENKICINTGNNMIMLRKIDLAFPAVRRIMENAVSSINLTVDKRELLPCLKRIKSIVKNNDENKNGATFIFSESGLEIKAISNKAKATEKLKNIKSKDLKISLNIEFVLQFLEHTEIIEWGLSRHNSAVSFAEGNYKYLCMPLALRGD